MDWVVVAWGLGVVGWTAYAALVRAGVVRQSAGAMARHWQEAAKAAGLSAIETSRYTVAGRAGGLWVRLTRWDGGPTSGTRITVSGPGLADLTVRPEGVGTVLESLRGTREIETGHDTFDVAAWVQGTPAVVRAVLDADNRRALRALFGGRLERPGGEHLLARGRLEEGALMVDVVEREQPESGLGGLPGPWSASADGHRAAERLGETVRGALALARRFATPGDVARRIGENLKSEPVAGVRLHCLTTLVREFPDHPATREALLAARADPDAGVRVRAGIALGPEGRDVLLAVASGEGAEDALTERAVASLGWHLTIAQALAILGHALRTRREATARACLGALGHRGGAEAVSTLAKVLALEKPRLAEAAADALGQTGDPAAEDALLAALEGPHASVRAAAIRALGLVGTVAAVQPLKDAQARESALRAVARQAIALIQSRASGAAPGQLSLAGGASGQLSLSGEEEGRLSLAPGATQARAREGG